MKHLLLAAAVASLTCCSAAQARELARWDFNTETPGWTPNTQTQLSVADGQLTVNSTGRDPFFSASVTGVAGWHRLTLSARHQGTTDVQIFWTTEKAPGTSEANSARSEFRGQPDTLKSLTIHFHTDSPLTSLRIDPLNQPGQMVIDKIVLTDDQFDTVKRLRKTDRWTGGESEPGHADGQREHAGSRQPDHHQA